MAQNYLLYRCSSSLKHVRQWVAQKQAKHTLIYGHTQERTQGIIKNFSISLQRQLAARKPNSATHTREGSKQGWPCLSQRTLIV